MILVDGPSSADFADTADTADRQLGPAVCVDCIHVRNNGRSPDGEDWRCLAHPPEVQRPAWRDPVSGKTHGPWFRHVYCVKKNADGRCPDFKERGALVQIRTDGSPYRREPDSLVSAKQYVPAA